MTDIKIKGYLKITVLRLIADSPKTGYQLMSELEKLYSKKPSAGSMYPLLKELEQKKFITSKKEGRKIIYKITLAGRKRLRELMSQQHNKIIQTNKLLQETVKYTEKEDKKIIMAMNEEARLAFEYMMKGSIEFKNFKKEMLILISNPNFSKKKEEAQKIIEEATQKIKELNKK